MKIQTIMAIAGAVAAAVVAVVTVDTHRFVVQSYHITNPKLNKKMRFVVLADLHGRSFGKNGKLEQGKDTGCYYRICGKQENFRREYSKGNTGNHLYGT